MSAKDPISEYAEALPKIFTEICNVLRREIDTTLPKATAKIWHAMPVWFIGENPVVGYKAGPKHVNLLFWNGQAFAEPALKPAGKFKAAQVQFTDVSQIDVKSLRRWLKKAGKDIWDYQGHFNAQKAMQIKGKKLMSQVGAKNANEAKQI